MLGDSFVDVGCGLGGMFRHSSCKRCIGLDVNPFAVDYLVRLGYDARIINKDGTFPLESSSTDAIVCDQVIEHIVDPTTILHECKRILKPGGLFLVGVPCTKGYKRDPDHKVMYSVHRLVHLLSRQGFTAKKVFFYPLPFEIFGRFFSQQYLDRSVFASS